VFVHSYSSAIMNVLHVLLPPPSIASHHYNPRHRSHMLSLHEHATHLSDCNFLLVFCTNIVIEFLSTGSF